MILALLLAGCGTPPAATPTDSDTQPPEPPPPSGETPLEWLGSADFIPAPQEVPAIIPASLPEGFSMLGDEPAGFTEGTLPSGNIGYGMEWSFEKPSGDQVGTDDSITVSLWAYAQPEGRAEHFDIIAEEGYNWAFYALDGHTIARYFTSGLDGRMWISGPYLVVIYSGLDVSEIGPWVDTFAGLYLEMFPPQRDAQSYEPPPPSGETPMEWLSSAAFVPAPQEFPPVILPSTLPEGFDLFEDEPTELLEAAMPAGNMIYGIELYFEKPVDNQVYVEDTVSVTLVSYAEPEGRTEHFGLAFDPDSTWAFYELDGATIARFYTSSGDGRAWISGPYLIVIYSGLDVSEIGPWVDTFASLYLELFPPQ
jgi:hypothetical protein